MFKRISRIVLLGATVAVLLAGAAGSPAATHAKPKPKKITTITVQAIPIAPIAPLYVGLKHHFFQDEGLAVNIVINFQGGAANLAPVIAGQADIGFSDVVPTILALKQGLDLVSLAACAASERTYAKTYVAWTVKGDSSITKPADLAGKSMATNTLNNVVHVTTLAALDKYGVDPSKVKLVVLPLPALVSAVSQGKVDAAQQVEPFLTAAKTEGQRPVLFPFVDALPKGGAISTYYTTRTWVLKHPDAAKRFQRAMNKSTLYASQHPAELRAAIPNYAGTDPDVAKKMNLPSFDPKNLGPQGVTTLANLMVKYGFMDSIPANLKQLYPPPVT